MNDYNVHSIKYQKIKNGIISYLLLYNPKMTIGETITLNEIFQENLTGKTLQVVVSDIESSNAPPCGINDNWSIVSFKRIDNVNYEGHVFYEKNTSDILELKYVETDIFNRHTYIDKNNEIYKSVSKYGCSINEPENLYTINHLKEPYKQINKNVVVVKDFSNFKIDNRFRQDKIF